MCQLQIILPEASLAAITALPSASPASKTIVLSFISIPETTPLVSCHRSSAVAGASVCALIPLVETPLPITVASNLYFPAFGTMYELAVPFALRFVIPSFSPGAGWGVFLFLSQPNARKIAAISIRNPFFIVGVVFEAAVSVGFWRTSGEY